MTREFPTNVACSHSVTIAWGKALTACKSTGSNVIIQYILMHNFIIVTLTELKNSQIILWYGIDFMCRQCSKITEIFSYLNCFWLFLDRSSRMTPQKFMETTYYVPNNSKGLKIYDPSKGCSMILKVGHCFLVIKSVLFYLCAQNKKKKQPIS